KEGIARPAQAEQPSAGAASLLFPRQTTRQNSAEAFDGIVRRQVKEGNVTEVTFDSTSVGIGIFRPGPHQSQVAASNGLNRRKPMKRQRQFPTWSGAILGTICALLVL